MKRAGVILGVVFLVVAIILNIGIQRKKTGNTEKEAPKVVEQQKEKEEKEEEEVKEEKKTEPEVVEVVKEVVKVETKEISSIVEIKEGDIGNFDLREEIMTIEARKILVLDMNSQSKEDKAVIYVFKSKDSRGMPITMVVNEVVYDTKSVGDKLQVKYKVLENSKGVEFAAIQSIKEVE